MTFMGLMDVDSNIAMLSSQLVKRSGNLTSIFQSSSSIHCYCSAPDVLQKLGKAASETHGDGNTAD
jgi:hypothetical protein